MQQAALSTVEASGIPALICTQKVELFSCGRVIKPVFYGA